MNFYLKPRLITGKGCIEENAKLIAAYGKKCIIVCGANSAKRSGALDAVEAVLSDNGTEWTVFNKIAQNPSLESCFEAGRLAAGFGAEFVIGIGGGSALDAAKVTAVAASNPGLSFVLSKG